MTTPMKHRGLAGAVRYALWIAAVGLVMAAAAAVVIFLLTGSPDAGYFGLRCLLFSTSAAVAAGFSRWLCRAEYDKFLSLKTARGDLGGAAGMIAGIGLAGALGPPLPTPTRPTVEALQVGQPVVLSGPTLDGKRFDLADFKGKVVLVDFWATWCGPCVAELPTVQAVYDQYHADGFEVVGVSLDNAKPPLVKFLADHPHPWPQVFDDRPESVGFRSPLAQRFGVQAIPMLFVVGRDGTVAAVDVRGDDIGRAVAAALGKESPASAASMRWLAKPAELVFRGLVLAAWWLLPVCVVGLAAVGAGVERLVREPAG